MKLDACLPYKKGITAMYNSSSGRLGELSEVDWQIYECFYYFLKVFYDARVTLSSVHYPTFHHAIHKLYKIINQFDMHREVPIFKDIVAFME